ncbi:MAG: indole-3-glycerol phosphate synthase TrpC [Candidatus Omnitrophota bacterium]
MAKKDALKEIIQKKKERLVLAKLALSQEDLKLKVQGLPATRPFIEAIHKPRTISLIAEIKKQSPSAGLIRENFNHIEIAKIYQDSGVQAISVLTEEDFFGGSLAYLEEVKNAVTIPVLRKDFILEPYQIYESRVFGADAILLIADLLSQETISEFVDLAASLGLESLVETHNEKDLKKVLKLKQVNLIGVNNRDLHSLEVDFKTTEKLFTLIPKEKIIVIESGIKSSQDVLFLKILGASAVLVGQAFMESRDIRKKVEEVMGW